MNKYYFSALLFSVPLLATSVNYDEFRACIKERMYQGQAGLMKRDQYFAFVEPYLREAEKVLVVMGYCKENPESALCHRYMMCMRNYTNACFHNTVKTSSLRRDALNYYSENLLACINTLKAQKILIDLDVQQEYKKTLSLIHRANRDYYKALSYGAKISLWVGRVFNPYVR